MRYVLGIFQSLWKYITTQKISSPNKLRHADIKSPCKRCTRREETKLNSTLQTTVSWTEPGDLLHKLRTEHTVSKYSCAEATSASNRLHVGHFACARTAAPSRAINVCSRQTWLLDDYTATKLPLWYAYLVQDYFCQFTFQRRQPANTVWFQLQTVHTRRPSLA